MPVNKLYLDPNLQIVFGVTLMAILSVSSIIPVLPDMARNIKGLTTVNIGLVITAFTLPGAIMAPVAGILGDRMGRKTLLIPSLFVFGIFGTACFFAQDLTTLLIFRFLQGLGAGPLGMINLTIIGDLYSGRERMTAMGYNASVLSIGTAIFPAVGGLLAIIGWQWPFLLPALAIPLGLLAAAKLETPKVNTTQKLGAYLKDAFARMRTVEAMAIFAVTFLTFIVLYGPIVTYLPILLDHRFGTPASSIGIIIALSSFITAMAASQLGKLSARFPGSTLMGMAFCCYAISMIFIPLMPGQWWVILPVLFFGLGQGLNIPTLMTVLTALAPMEQRAAFMAANGMILRLSQTVAPMLMALFYVAFGIQAVFWAGAGAAGLMLLLVPALRRAEQIRVDRER
ncbi:MAG: MFS transporter [Proteobacteria bacterium]|nr:MFS transporter [Pseudomonadota bacterium]MBU1610684.1 MFS transporter [Pseudomonadota bacterium]